MQKHNFSPTFVIVHCVCLPQLVDDELMGLDAGETPEELSSLRESIDQALSTLPPLPVEEDGDDDDDDASNKDMEMAP